MYMSTAFLFAKFIYESSGDKKSPTEVAIYNALRRIDNPKKELNGQQLRKLFSALMSFPHWRDKKADLVRCFERYYKAFQNQYTELNQILFSANDFEIINMTSAENVKSFLFNYYTEIYPDAKIQCTSFRKKEWVVLVLQQDQSLKVHHHNQEFSLYQGKLRPLWEDFCLVYTADLRLDKSFKQKLLVAPFRFLDFVNEDDAWLVFETQGYTIKHLRPKNFYNLDEHSELFYQLKALESKFIQKSSDPLYLQITRNLEEIIEKVAENPDLHKERAIQVYQKGRNAFENIFTDDRLLHLLLKELAMTIAAGRAKTWDEPEQENGEEWLKLDQIKVSDLTNI